MYYLNESPGRTVHYSGKEYLFFSGYSYLGMGHVPEFADLLQQGTSRWGMLHPSSRLSNTRLTILDDLEELVAQITGFEQAVSFSSGFLAGRAVADVLANHYDHIYMAPHTHPAVQVGINQLEGDDWRNQ